MGRGRAAADSRAIFFDRHPVEELAEIVAAWNIE
jgi:hypothetical protein